MNSSLYLGIMSGTSADGIDAALVDFSGYPDAPIHIVASAFTPFEDALREQIMALFTPGDNEIDRLGELDNALGQAYADAVTGLLQATDVEPRHVGAIGLHGQTIRHRPEAHSPFTLQIGNPYFISQKLGVTVVNDFRRADMVLAGQGAPLAPVFHQALFQSSKRHRVIINTGGIANISYLPPEGALQGFDTGPANGLMDFWIESHQGQRFDADGAWARNGSVIESLLKQWLDDPYYRQSPPKSTGKEYFTPTKFGLNSEALIGHAPADIQRTLCELSAATISDAIGAFCAQAEEIFICGGGAHNGLLVERIAALSGLPVATTAALGVAPDWVEAVGFAWLARACMEGIATDTRSVTGAKQPPILGAIHPGRNTITE